MNAVQRDRFRGGRGDGPGAALQPRQFAPASASAATMPSTSSGPGLALYGGVPRDEAEGHIAQVAFPEAEVVQRRTVRAGESIGYGATWTADARHRGGDRQHRLCRRLSALLRRRAAARRSAARRCR